MYQLTANPDQILRLSDRAFIPRNAANRDWKAYQAWLDQGHEPLPADT